jgi:hypothetical protein
MSRTKTRQDTQLWNSESYVDSIAPTEAAFETSPLDGQTDLTNIRSYLHELRDVRSSDWWRALTAPTAFPGEGAAARGVQNLNVSLYDIERKRIARRRAVVGANVGPIAVNAQHAILNATGELPGNTTAAVGVVATRGTIVASVAGAFDAPSLAEVGGASNIQPMNLCLIVDTATGEPIEDSTGREVYGLIQTEIATDGHTINLTTQRAQLSFVVRNATYDDLVLAAAGTMDGLSIDYAPVERYAFKDIPEEAWLGDDFVDAGAGTATRQTSYSNQGTTPVDLVTNATLDIESAGKYWEIRDDAEQPLFRITEGSGAGTTSVAFEADVDLFRVDAILNDFDNGISANTGGTRPIDVGVQDGIIESTAGALELEAATVLSFDDGYKPVGWSLIEGIHLADSAAEWTNFEAEFGGEVSLLNAIVQAKQSTERATAWANVIVADIPADTLIKGDAVANISAVLPSYKGLSFITDVEIFINGTKQRPGATALSNNDVYPSAVAAEQALGNFYAEFVLRFRGGNNPDNINMVVWGQPTP